MRSSTPSTTSEKTAFETADESRAMRLDGIINIWTCGSRSEQNQLRARLLQGSWLRACQYAVKDRQIDEVERWLGGVGIRSDIYSSMAQSDPNGTVGEFRVRQMRAYLLCAKAAMANNGILPDEILLKASAETGLPGAFYRDLLALMYNHALPVSPIRAQRLSVILVGLDGTGVVAQLVLERFHRGTGSFYPSPALGFVYREETFSQSEQSARHFARSNQGKWNDESDVRWSLEGVSHGVRRLSGGSLGGAFAVGLQILFANPCDLSRFAVSASLADDGSLGRIENWEEKVLAARFAERGIRAVFTANSEAYNSHSCRPVSIRIVKNVASTVAKLQSLQRLQLWHSARRIILVPVTLVLTVYLSGLALTHLVHSYSFKGGQRVFVTIGVPSDYMPHCAIDTGFIMNDFRASESAHLEERGTVWRAAPEHVWADEIAEALPLSAQRVKLFMRLGRTQDAIRDAMPFVNSEASGECSDACDELIELEPAAKSVYVAILRHRFDKAVGTSNLGDVTDYANALLTADALQSGHVAHGLRKVILRTGNNFNNVPNLRVLLRADPGQRQFAINFLKPLLHDAAIQVDIEAASLLFEIDPSEKVRTIKLVVDFLLSQNADINRAAFEGANTMGVLCPADLTRAMVELDRVRPGGLWPLQSDPNVPPATRTSAHALVNYLMAVTPEQFRTSAMLIDDVSLSNRDVVETYTRFAGMKIATVSLHHHGNMPLPDYLLKEMQEPVSNYWAIYRNGCGYAIAFTTPAPLRPTMINRLTKLWKHETRAHVKIALAIAIEQLRTNKLIVKD